MITGQRFSEQVFHLPPLVGDFIGRETDLAEVNALFDSQNCHLVTLCGPGGIGKTRLALEIARSRQEYYRNGTVFASLTSLFSPETIVPHIAASLNFTFQKDRRSQHQQLLDLLEHKQLLLLLDNFEHLLDGVWIVSDILEVASEVDILVTSREVLSIDNELVYDVSGLHVPATHTSFDKGYTFDAIQLFEKSATEVWSRFSLATEYSGVVKICQLVRGMPLAIEIAADWCRVLACEDIAREIQVQLDFLASENPDLAKRHQSMQVVFDTSWRLLSNAEREVFPKLAVFRDSFSLDAVRSVTHTSLTILASLIDKSLLWKLPSGRYELHELVRQYAEQHLMAAGQHDMTLEAHCHYYSQFMAQCMEGLKAHQQIETLNRIDQDFENIRQAWHCAIDYQLLEQLNAMLEGLDLYCQMRNRFEDKASLFASALEQLDQTDNPAVAATRARLILRSPSLYLDEVHHILESGMFDQSPRDRAYALYLIGINRPDDEAWFDESIVLFRELKEHYYLSRILDHYAFRHMMRGDHVTAKALFSESLALCMAHGNIFSEGRVVANMGTLAHASNDLPGFERYSDAAYQICVKINDWLGALYARANYILVCVLQYGQVTRAIHQLNELMTVVDDIAHPGARGRILLYRGFFQSDLLEAWRDFEVSQPHVADHPILRHATHLGLANVHGYQGDLLISKQHLITAYRGYQRDFEVVTLAAITLLLVAHYYCHQKQFDNARIALALALTHYPEHLRYIDEIPYTRALVETIRATAGPATFEKALKDSRTRNPEVFLEDCIQRYEAELADRFQPVYEQAHHANQLLVEPLTRREIEIVYLVAQGMRNRDIAEELVVAEDTIKKHLTHIFGKLNVSSRSQLIKKAQSLKLL